MTHGITWHLCLLCVFPGIRPWNIKIVLHCMTIGDKLCACLYNNIRLHTHYHKILKTCKVFIILMTNWIRHSLLFFPVIVVVMAPYTYGLCQYWWYQHQTSLHSYQIQCTVQFYHKYSQKTPIAHPSGWGKGSFVDPASDCSSFCNHLNEKWSHHL